MQYFINHAAIERASGEIFAGPRARLYLFCVVALLTAAAAGLAPAAIWLGLVLLADEARNTFATRLTRLSVMQAKAARLALDCFHGMFDAVCFIVLRIKSMFRSVSSGKFIVK